MPSSASSRNVQQVTALLSSAEGEELAALISRYATDPRKSVQTAVQRSLKRLEASREEEMRLASMYEEMASYSSGLVIGADEVGRGPLAGPLTVCAVALPPEPRISGLNDSKQLSPSKREYLSARIEEVALGIGIAHIEPHDIDSFGMSWALREAFRLAIERVGLEPDCVLIDGNPLHVHQKEQNVIKGDGKIAAIAAASIVAKVTRDSMMIAYDEQYPGWDFAASKGYASPAHIAAIKEKGLSPIHRVSFCGNFLEQPHLF